VSHLRKSIRKAIVDLLRSSSTLAGPRVHDTAYKPRAAFPALLVLCPGEDQELLSDIGGADRVASRTLHLDISAEVQQVANAEDTRDDLLAQVEALLAAAAAAGAITGVRDIQPVGMRVDDGLEGQMPITVGRQRFAVTYFTTTGNPTAPA